MVRPLFLEFPDAAPDRHPLDIDLGAGAEFMLGGSLLVAPSPYPEELDSYAVRFPSHAWYDFWTGEKIPDSVPQQDSSAPHAFAPLPTLTETPKLDRLPVYVRGGSILPMAPLVESTDETPAGPLTLRVYAGEPCAGSLYEDDGRTFAYRRGVYLRMKFRCEVSAERLRITIGAWEGSWPAWWKQIRLEVYGWTPASNQITIDGRPSGLAIERMDNGFAFVVADTEAGTSVEVR